jgi:O-antigen/teichoic acid export membrane protein
MQHIARSIILNVVGFAWSAILVLAVTPFIVRGLGETSYGVWALVGNVVGYMAVFNSLQTAGSKYLAEYLALNNYENIRKLRDTSLIFNLTIGALAGTSILILAEPLATRVFEIPPELQVASVSAFRIAGVAFFLGTVGWWGGSILVGAQRFDRTMIISVVTNTLSMLGSVLTVALGWGLIGVSVANLVGVVLSVILYISSVRKLLPDEKWSFAFDWTMLKRILPYGFFSTLHVIFGVLMSQLDRTLLGIWIGVTAVTIYSIPLSVASRIHQICAKALEVILPLSSGLDAQSRTEEIRRVFLRAQNLNVVIVMMLSVPLAILSQEILKFWISPSFALEAAGVFRLLVIAYALLALNVVMAGMVAGFGHPEVNTTFVMLLGMGNLIGYILLIPRWGVNGAGMASVLGSLISVPVFLWYVNYRFMHIPLHEVISGIIVRPTFASIITGVYLFLTRHLIFDFLTLLLALAGSCVVFFLMTVLLGVWQDQEFGLLRYICLRILPNKGQGDK